MTQSGIAAYGRLSRQDEADRSTPMSEKIALRKSILITLAKHAAGIDLAEEQIVFEVESGGSLTERPGLLSILEKCRRKELHTLILFDIDRLTRDIGDWKVIESALFKGAIRLITSRGNYEFTPHFDPAMLQIMAVMGEKERRSFSYRRKATNVQRTRQGQLSQGYAPYGYRWIVAEKRYEVNPAEYPIVEEIFRRAWREGVYTIAKDLNTRGVPTPGTNKRVNPSPIWLRGGIRKILTNPFYAGFVVQRRETDREGAIVDLPRSQWVWSEEQSWPHPISRDDWERLLDIMSGRLTGEATKSLLSGLLYCAQGERMCKRIRDYFCECGREAGGERHKGQHIRSAVVERLVIDLLVRTIEALPSTILKPRRKAEPRRDETERERAGLRRDLREKEATMEELVRRSSFYHSLPGYGEARLTETLTALGREVEALRARLLVIEEKLSAPDFAQIAPLLERVKAAGVRETLEICTTAERRRILSALVRRIQLDPVPAGKGMTRSIQVTLNPLTPDAQETTHCLPIIHPRMGVKRGPYLWRKKPPPPESSEEGG